MMKQATLAAVLALCALGCASGGSLTEPPLPCAEEAGTPSAVAQGGRWVWCDGSPPSESACAVDYEPGHQAAICTDALCTPVVARWGEWAEELGNGIVGDCLEPGEDGTTLWLW